MVVLVITSDPWCRALNVLKDRLSAGSVRVKSLYSKRLVEFVLQKTCCANRDCAVQLRPFPILAGGANSEKQQYYVCSIRSSPYLDAHVSALLTLRSQRRNGGIPIVETELFQAEMDLTLTMRTRSAPLIFVWIDESLAKSLELG